MLIDDFKQILLDYYNRNRRDLPWRRPNAAGTFDPYTIMVSEIMLQQTQVPRVIEKYTQFLDVFPDVRTLARASLGDVLLVWQGLGYNRRGRFLREAARIIEDEYAGSMPLTVKELTHLPGIGPNTAGAILVYSYNQPLIFIETNIRSVYLHHFFPDREMVADKELLELVTQTIDRENPREFYWALMDYGSYIKRTFGNPNVRAKEYKRQSVFEGSNRQLRGMILRQLSAGPRSLRELRVAADDPRLDTVLASLVKDRMVVRQGRLFSIAA